MTYAVGRGLHTAAAEFFSKCRQTLHYPPTLVTSPLCFVSDRSQIRDCDVWVFDGGEGTEDLAVIEDALARGARHVRFLTTGPGSCTAKTIAAMPGVATIAVPASASLHSSAMATLLAMLAALLTAASVQNGDPALDAAVRSYASEAAETRFSAAHLALVTGKIEREVETCHLSLLVDPGLRAVSAVFRDCMEPTMTTFVPPDMETTRPVSGETVFLSFSGLETRRGFARIIESAGSYGNIAYDYKDCGRLQTFLAILDAAVLARALSSEDRFARPCCEYPALRAPCSSEDDLLFTVRRRGPAVRQKQAAHAERDHPAFQDVVWPAAFDRFRDGLARDDIQAVVLDYDGTVIAPDDPEALPAAETIADIVRLLENGLTVAIATGRGPSLGDALRPLLPQSCWDDIIVGYYNGSYLKPLSVDISREPPAKTAEIQALVEKLSRRPELFKKFRPVDHGVQLTFERGDLVDPDAFRREFIVSSFGVASPLKILCSGAWFDFVHIGASKKRVFDTIASKLPSRAGILCIGDNGNRAGNDHDLLGHPLGLSVGNVCDRPSAGWSLFGETCTGPAALRKTLQCLQPVSLKSMRFSGRQSGC
ncbi:HAD hydrolase family protein [Rhizobium leguminosarum bv. viciae]|nr:HAD hydrolase family protein [Rhizobium leguminosarum bv. viciae]